MLAPFEYYYYYYGFVLCYDSAVGMPSSIAPRDALSFVPCADSAFFPFSNLRPRNGVLFFFNFTGVLSFCLPNHEFCNDETVFRTLEGLLLKSSSVSRIDESHYCFCF